MEYSDAISIFALIVSVLAFFMGAFALYLNHFRIKNSLYLVRLDEIFSRNKLSFGLVNSGNKDILITEISCWFINPDDKSGCKPKQQAIINGGGSNLLSKEKVMSCSVDILGKLDKEFFKKAKSEKENGYDVFVYNVEINVSWIDTTSKSFNKALHYQTYEWISAIGGGIRFSSTDGDKFDLYTQESSSHVMRKTVETPCKSIKKYIPLFIQKRLSKT